MTKSSFSRREFIKGGVGLSVMGALPYAPSAFAQAENDRIVAAAKSIGKTDVTGMIWSNYFIPMQPSMEDFRKQSGIGTGKILDISVFDIPQRAMAEALSRSPQIDFFHLDAGMIPSLASESPSSRSESTMPADSTPRIFERLSTAGSPVCPSNSLAPSRANAMTGR